MPLLPGSFPAIRSPVIPQERTAARYIPRKSDNLILRKPYLPITRLFPCDLVMKISAGFLVALLLFFTIMYPALAFQADTLTISLEPNGDALVEFTYHLSWLEYFAVFMRISDPALELKRVLEENLRRPVYVQSAGMDSISLRVETYARVERSDGFTTLRTPALSFAATEKVLESYWFAPFITPDFSPAITRVQFPYGYEETFSEAASIPALTHAYPS